MVEAFHSCFVLLCLDDCIRRASAYPVNVAFYAANTRVWTAGQRLAAGTVPGNPLVFRHFRRPVRYFRAIVEKQ